MIYVFQSGGIEQMRLLQELKEVGFVRVQNWCGVKGVLDNYLSIYLAETNSEQIRSNSGVVGT